ncbi:MAG: hypothetical protein ACE14V_04665 [bacterium]
MKRREIIIWIHIIIGVGFYLGYRLSQKKHILEAASSIPNQKIVLEYQLASPQRTDDPGRCVIDQTNTTYTCKGIMSLYVLLNSIVQQDRKLVWNNFPKLSGRNYWLEIAPDIGKRKYALNLTCPHNESSEYLFSVLGKELGFRTLVTETTIRFYRAVRNQQPIRFAKMISNDNAKATYLNNICNFTNMDMGLICSLYSSEGLIIENETGITDRYNGSLRMYNTIEEVKKELQTKAGIDLNPFEKTVKLIKVY